MPFQATLKFDCWKQHTCCYCGARYRYLFQKTKTAQGSTQEQARQALEQAVLESVKKEVNLVACPECGHYQPDMLRSQKTSLLVILLLATLLVLALEIVFSVIGTIADRLIIYILGGLGVVVTLSAVFFGLGNSNRNLEANRRKSQREEEQGQVQLLTPAETQWEPLAFRGRLLSWASLLLLLLGALAPFSAEWFRTLQGWPLNEDWSPQVVGPGDYAWTWFPSQGLQAVKGYWLSARESATVVNAAEVGLRVPTLNALSSQQNWGDSISVKSGEKSQAFRPWCGIYLPGESNLAGKSVTVKLDLTITYPMLRGNNQYDNQTRDVSHVATLTLAAPRAGATYRTIWGLSGGLGLGLVSVVLLATLVRLNRVSAQALPTEISQASDETDNDHPRADTRDGM